MVDQKMYELGTRKSTIRDVFEYGRRLAAREGEDKVFDFSLGNPNVPAPEYIKEAALDILQSMEPAQIHGYTVAPGAPMVRKAIAQSIKERFGLEITEKNLFMTAGAAAACTICFKALFEEGDEYLTFAPFFPQEVATASSPAIIRTARTRERIFFILYTPEIVFFEFPSTGEPPADPSVIRTGDFL